MMHLELMRIHSVFPWPSLASDFEEKRIENWSKRCASGAQVKGLVKSASLRLTPGANARLERQARIEKELMQQNTQVRASCMDGSQLCAFSNHL